MSKRASADFSGAACPTPIGRYEQVVMAHGGGGRLTRDLIEQYFARRFDNPLLAPLGDGALLDVEAGRVAISTDSFVIHPIEFPGGNIGSLAVHGTVNDLAMCGAEPIALSLAVILEEGLSFAQLDRIADAAATAARGAPVPIATGDTKVVERGKGDGVFINTTGLGRILPNVDLRPTRIQPGDAIVVNGGLAEHGVAILSVREHLEFGVTIESDAASLWPLVRPMLQRHAAHVRMLRDPTRGGVAAALNELAEAAGAGMRLEEASLPLREEVRGACELLGLDPLYVANEGKCLAIVAPEAVEQIVAEWRATTLGRDAMVIGHVVAEHAGQVRMRSTIGGERIVPMLSGEQLPRIC